MNTREKRFMHAVLGDGYEVPGGPSPRYPGPACRGFQMPTGWPEAPHVEPDERALSGRTDAVTGPASEHLGLPLLTPDRTRIDKVDVLGLELALAWLREVARAG